MVPWITAPTDAVWPDGLRQNSHARYVQIWKCTACYASRSATATLLSGVSGPGSAFNLIRESDIKVPTFWQNVCEKCKKVEDADRVSFIPLNAFEEVLSSGRNCRVCLLPLTARYCVLYPINDYQKRMGFSFKINRSKGSSYRYTLPVYSWLSYSNNSLFEYV